MKCPYRTSTTCEMDDDIYEDSGRVTQTHEEFEECYGTECPFYIPAQTIHAKDCCRKVEKEVQ